MTDPAGFPLLAGGPYMPDGTMYTAALLDTYLTAKIDALYALVLRPAVSWLRDDDGGSIANNAGTGISSYSAGQTYVNDPLTRVTHASGVQTLGVVGEWEFEATITWSAPPTGAVPYHWRGAYILYNGSQLTASDGADTKVFAAAGSGVTPTIHQTVKGSLVTTAPTDTLQFAVYQNTGAALGYDSAVFKVRLR